METLRYVVLVNGLLAVVTVAFYALLRRETFFEANRLALWLGLTASLVLPLLELPDWRPQPVRTVMQRTAQVIVPRVLPGPLAPQSDVIITFPNGRTYPVPRQSIASNWSWQQKLLGLYVAVLIVLLIRFGVRLTSLMRLIQQSVHEPYDDFALVKNERVTSPFSFFAWVVLNPDHHAPNELEQILRHERVHVRAWHSIDMIAAELISIILWFNPAVYLFQQLVHQTLEFSADRAVLAEGIDPQSYQYNLVKVSLSAGQTAITNHFSHSSWRHRVKMMNRRRSGYLDWMRYLLLVSIMLSLAFACQFSRNGPSHRYIEQHDDDFYGLITTEMSEEDLDTLRQELSQRAVKLDIGNINRLPNGQIRQIVMTLNVPKPGHPIDVSVGSSLGQSPIPAIGLHCDEKGCRLGSVTDQFPDRLKQMAVLKGTQFVDESYSGFETTGLISDANSVFGLYRVYFRNDFLESNYFGLRSTGVRMTPDFHLDLYPEYRNAVVFLDGQEISREKLNQFHVIDLKKVVIFNGRAAVVRLGDERAKSGLILIFRLKNIAIRDKYAATPLLEEVYPQLFALHQ